MSLQEIDHVVVLMLENRSFDCLLGTLYPRSEEFEGLPTDASNTDLTGHPHKVWDSHGLGDEAMSVPTPDPGELFEDMNMQLFNGRTHAGMTGFAQNYQVQSEAPPYHPRNVMHHYEEHQVPVLRQLAKSFAVSDQWHASAPCQTWPNRFFAHTGTAGGYANNEPVHFPYRMPTIFGRLQKKGLPWRVYFHDMPQALTLEELWPHIFHFRLFDDFKKDARDGKLPAYSFIEPRYFTDLSLPNDQHPPHNVTLGEQLIAEVYNAVRQGKSWRKTLLIITYDEHGGIFDHVPPGEAVPPSEERTEPFNFDRYGVRVPAVLVSPYIKEGTILRSKGRYPFDHTSIIATLRKRFDLGAPLTDRDAAAPDLEGVFTLSEPVNDGPAEVRANPYEPSREEIRKAKAAPPNHHQRALNRAPPRVHYVRVLAWVLSKLRR